MPCPPELCEGPTDNTQFKVPMFHVGFEYLYWYTRKFSLPTLVTAGNPRDVVPGAVGRNGTRVLLQGTDLDDNQQHGLRLTFGVGLDNSDEWSLLLTAFSLEQSQDARSFTGSGAPDSEVLARPFFDIANNIENADPVAFPSIASGSLAVNQKRRFYGGDVDLRWEYYNSDVHRIHLIAGVKLLWLEESVGFRMTSQDLPGQGVPGNRYDLAEDIGATNRFYGGQLGAAYEFRLGPVFIGAIGKCALGAVDVQPNLTAFTRITEPTGAVTQSSDRALYVTPNTVGTGQRTKFAVVPEAQLKVGFDFNEYVRVSVGYTAIYISDVSRAGALINRNVNIQPVGTPLVFTPPAAALDVGKTSNFWAQGLDLTLRFSF